MIIYARKKKIIYGELFLTNALFDICLRFLIKISQSLDANYSHDLASRRVSVNSWFTELQTTSMWAENITDAIWKEMWPPPPPPGSRGRENEGMRSSHSFTFRRGIRNLFSWKSHFEFRKIPPAPPIWSRFFFLTCPPQFKNHFHSYCEIHTSLRYFEMGESKLGTMKLPDSFFHWRRVDLQCFVHFWYTAK